MPASQVERTLTVRSEYGGKIRISANRTGWEVMWADYATDTRQRAVDAAVDNIADALRYLASKGHFEGDPEAEAARSRPRG